MIARKLNVLRRIYAAVAAGLRADNPAMGIRAPRNRRAPEGCGYLSDVELMLLFLLVHRKGPRSPGVPQARPRRDTARPLAVRGQVPNDAAGEPLLAVVGNFASGHL
jgi:hypothetical protein